MQRHQVRRDDMHVDFSRADLDKTVDVEVPLHLEGEAELVARENGVIDHVLVALLITAKPSSIPSGLTVDITNMVIGDVLRVSDITLPEGVTTPVEPEEAVVTATHQVSDEIAEPTEGEAPAEGAAAEAAEAAGDEAGEGGDEG
jgi:large subunit ribosomal protein L25